MTRIEIKGKLHRQMAPLSNQKLLHKFPNFIFSKNIKIAKIAIKLDM
jgi:hypothetical protein